MLSNVTGCIFREGSLYVAMKTKQRAMAYASLELQCCWAQHQHVSIKFLWNCRNVIVITVVETLHSLNLAKV